MLVDDEPDDFELVMGFMCPDCEDTGYIWYWCHSLDKTGYWERAECGYCNAAYTRGHWLQVGKIDG